MIVLEEEVIPTVDFLNFLGQCLPSLEADKTLAGASSFNYNGKMYVIFLPLSGYSIILFKHIHIGFLVIELGAGGIQSNKNIRFVFSKSWSAVDTLR